MSGFKTSLYVGGDATGAKKALAETTSALGGTQKATDSLNKSTSALDQSTRSAANENSNFATGEKAVQQAVTRSNTAVQQRIDRCAATNVDPETADRDLNIPKDLQRGFGHVDLGVYGCVTAAGRVAAGDRLVSPD